MPTAPKAITAYFAALEDTDSLKPTEDIARIEKALEQKDLPMLETLDLRLELDRLNDTSDAIRKLEDAFVKGFPSYARKAKVALPAALKALDGIVDKPVIDRISSGEHVNGTAAKPTNGRVDQNQIIAWMAEQTEPFMYTTIEESLGCGRSSAERAIKAAGDCVVAYGQDPVSGRSKAFVWQG